MEPVISPWIFYWMEVIENLGCLSAIILVVSFIGILIVGISFGVMGGFDAETLSKITIIFKKKILIVLAILCLICCFAPSKNTMMKMLIAKNVTYERVEQSVNIVEKVYNDIIEIVESKNIVESN